MSFRYIGSKARLAKQISEKIGSPTEGFFVDLFCGTGAIAEVAAGLGWQVRLNDHLTCATSIAVARLLSVQDGVFSTFGGYEATVALLNKCPPVNGFIWREYSPASVSHVGIERRYFTEGNAAKIDGIRKRIHEWQQQGAISRNEELLLLADLLSAVNRVANIAGTYGCFLSSWTAQAREQIALRPRELKPRSVLVETTNVDASRAEVGIDDLVYLDPPYTKRQYASYYHILETICKGDQPAVTGVSGLRPWKDLSSDYCFKVRALRTLTELIRRLPARRILLSYSNEGHIQLDALTRELESSSCVNVFELADIGRYRPNRKASARNASVKEYLVEIRRVRQATGKQAELATLIQ